MYRYKIKDEETGFTFWWDSKDEYEIGERVFLGDEGGEVLYDKNGEVVQTTFPKTIFGIVIEKETVTQHATGKKQL